MTPNQMFKAVREVARVGDVILFDSRGKTFYMRWIFRRIREAQKKMGFKHYKDIHAVLVVDFEGGYSLEPSGLAVPSNGIPLVLSGTVPKCVIEPLTISDRTIAVTVCRLCGSGEGFSDEWIQTMNEAADDLVGRGYDYLDFLAIKLRLQKWPRWITRWIDLGKKRVVCSGAVLYCLTEAWKDYVNVFNHKLPKSIISRPLGYLPVNKATPAHFHSDLTFEIVKEVKA